MTKTNLSHMQYDEWMKLTQDALSQLQAYCDDTMSYLNELTGEWRKLTLEATRRATELLRAKA